MDACHESIEWVRANNITTPADAWSKCDRGDWMLWFAGKRSGEPEGNGRKKLVLACCECARLALPYATSPTVLACIETAEAWAHGKATIEQVWEAKIAAATAYAAAANDDAELARDRALAECAEFVRAQIRAADIETIALKGRTS